MKTKNLTWQGLFIIKNKFLELQTAFSLHMEIKEVTIEIFLAEPCQ
jgi:hypothetical protein